MSIVTIVNGQTKAEQQVENAVELLRKAMISGDRTILNDIVSEDLSYGHSGGKIEDKATFIETLATKKSDFVSIELKNQQVKITNQTAIVRHQLFAKTNDGGVAGEVKLGIMLVWIKEGKTWKLLARQAFKLP
jgi:ketosteroid isomerase-like protein